MGATYFRTDKSPADVARAHFDTIRDSTILRLEEHDGQFYAALRIDVATPEAIRWGYSAGDVTAVVYLAARDRGGVLTREIGEEMGPVYWAASTEFLETLTPLPPGPRFDHARQWRERVRYERSKPSEFQTARQIPAR